MDLCGATSDRFFGLPQSDDACVNHFIALIRVCNQVLCEEKANRKRPVEPLATSDGERYVTGRRGTA